MTLQSSRARLINCVYCTAVTAPVKRFFIPLPSLIARLGGSQARGYLCMPVNVITLYQDLQHVCLTVRQTHMNLYTRSMFVFSYM